MESTTSDTNVRAAEPEEESLLQLDLTDITAAAAPQQKPAEPEVPLMTLVEEVRVCDCYAGILNRTLGCGEIMNL